MHQLVSPINDIFIPDVMPVSLYMSRTDDMEEHGKGNLLLTMPGLHRQIYTGEKSFSITSKQYKN